MKIIYGNRVIKARKNIGSSAWYKADGFWAKCQTGFKELNNYHMADEKAIDSMLIRAQAILENRERIMDMNQNETRVFRIGEYCVYFSVDSGVCNNLSQDFMDLHLLNRFLRGRMHKWYKGSKTIVYPIGGRKLYYAEQESGLLWHNESRWLYLKDLIEELKRVKQELIS